MSKVEIQDYKEAEARIGQEIINQHYKDTLIIRQIKKQIPKKLFHFIAVALHESENWVNLEIVGEPTGKYQQETKEFGMWVDQYCEYEDCYSGYCYVKLPDGRYLKWSYWM